jgi:hypothetical protein
MFSREACDVIVSTQRKRKSRISIAKAEHQDIQELKMSISSRSSDVSESLSDTDSSLTHLFI